MILLTDEEAVDLIRRANAPLVERLNAIERKMLDPTLLYTTEEVARLCHVSARTVRQWILQGRLDTRNIRHFLTAKELIRGKWVMELGDVAAFLKTF